jgi:hypothetical protein
MKLIICTAVAVALSGQILEPGRDHVKEMQKMAQKEAAEKNYKEMKESAAELAELSKQLSADITQGGQHVISARIFDRLDKIEKLTKRIRDKAKSAPPGIN